MKKIGIGIVAIVLLLVVVMIVAKGKSGAGANAASSTETVKKGRLLSQVVETGSLDAVKTVEIKSKVSGRVARLLVDEGDAVAEGQLIAVIDPEETELRVSQDRSRLKGAQAALAQIDVQIKQRKVTSKTELDRAASRVETLKLELDAQPSLTRAEIESAETAYNNAVKTRDLLTRVTQPNQRASLQNQVLEAESNLQNAIAEEERSRNLLAKGYISQRAYESAKNQLDLATARVTPLKSQMGRLDSEQALERDQAEESVKQAKAGLDRALANAFRDATKRKEYEQAITSKLDAEAALLDVQSLESSKMQQQANIQQIEDTLNDSLRLLRETEIRSPIAGVVTRRLVQVGELVASLSSFSSGTPIVRVEDRSKMLVKLQINEIDVAKLRLDMVAKIAVDAFPDREFTGRVTKIAPTDLATGAAPQPGGGSAVVKYEVEVAMEGVAPELKSGMSAKCTMIVLDRANVLVLPRQYVGKEEDGTYFVMLPPKDKKDKNAKPTKVKVVIGDSSATSIEITSGVKEGEVVQKPDYAGPTRKGMMEFGPDDGGGEGEGEEPGA
ncbi:MAG: efflux RND transporter periplasmic adaptor subunit [Fimbriimonadaceae bacterium]